MEINIIRGDKGLWITPAPPYLLSYLQYTKRSFKTQNWQKVDDYQKLLLYSLDGSGGIFTLRGFYTKVIKLIQKNLDTPKVEDRRTPMPEIDWMAVRNVGLRDYQILPLINFLNAGKSESGMFKGCGGFGKSRCIASTYAAWNSLNTVVAVPYKEVVEQLYKLFKELFPHKHVGRIGGGANDVSNDVTITTFSSLKNCSLEKTQLLLIDELQGTAGDKIQEIIGGIEPIRIFGYTATDQGLFSKADKVLKGFFGEPLITINYPEAIKMGAVVPCVVYFIKVPAGKQMPIGGSMEKKLREGILKNTVRNKLIGDVCKVIPESRQTLIFIDQVKNHLKNLITFLPPETKIIHRNSNKSEIKELALTPKEQSRNIQQFVDNEVQFLCSSDVLRAGFDNPNCRVVIQATGGSSVIEVLQEALRGSRVLTEDRRLALNVPPKHHFNVIDFWDEHDEALLNMSEKRKEHYLSQGWKVVIVNKVQDIDWNIYNPIDGA